MQFLQIAGLETNINFLLDLANHQEFKAGNVHTNFIRDNYDTLFKSRIPTKENLIQASVALILSDKALEMELALKRQDTFNPFVLESNFRINYLYTRKITFKYQDQGTIELSGVRLSRLSLLTYQISLRTLFMCLICSLEYAFLDYKVEVKYLQTENEYEISCDNGQTWDRIHATLITSNENRHILNCCINGHITKANFFSRPGYLTIFNEVYVITTYKCSLY